MNPRRSSRGVGFVARGPRCVRCGRRAVARPPVASLRRSADAGPKPGSTCAGRLSLSLFLVGRLPAGCSGGFPFKFFGILLQSSWSAGWERVAASRRARWASARRLSASFLGSSWQYSMTGQRCRHRGVANASQTRKQSVCTPCKPPVDGPRRRWDRFTPNETLARRIVRDVWTYTDGQAGVGPCCIQSRAVLSSGIKRKSTAPSRWQRKTDGWSWKALHSVRLTDAGRKLFGSKDR